MDLGAYSGLTTICFSKLAGISGKVIALEPDPINFNAAKKNVDYHSKINHVENIYLMQNAVAANHGTLKFSSEGAMGSADISIVGGYRGQVIDVECMSLLDIVQRHAIEKVDFIKMDIEGAEESTLAGAAEFFKKFRPRIIIEPHFVRGTLSQHAVIAVLESYNYQCNLIEQFGVGIPLITAYPN